MQAVPPSHSTVVTVFVLNRTAIPPVFGSPVLAKFVAIHPAGSSDRSTSVTIVLRGWRVEAVVVLGDPFHIVVAVLHSAAVAMGVVQVPLDCLYHCAVVVVGKSNSSSSRIIMIFESKFESKNSAIWYSSVLYWYISPNCVLFFKCVNLTHLNCLFPMSLARYQIPFLG